MIDSDDGDFFALGALASTGVAAIVFAVFAIVFYVVGAQNERECEARTCPQAHQESKLLDHECLCVERAPQWRLGGPLDGGPR